MTEKLFNQRETGIPIPLAESRGRPSVLPYRELEVGDSFSSGYYIDVSRFRNVRNKKFVCRRQIDDDGQVYWRVWRVA